MIATDPKRIVQRRLIGAPKASVFAAWSDAASMGQWMCPNAEMSGASVEIDFRVGGGFRIVMHGAEQDYEHSGEYLEIDEPHRLVFTWVSYFMAEADQSTRVTLELDEAGEGKTQLVLTHDQLPAGDTYDGHDSGWSEIVRLLATRLES